MIWSFLLSVVLFALASLGWGVVFSLDVARLGRRYLLASVVLAAVVSVFAAIFFDRGLVGAGENLSLPVTSFVFAAASLISLIVGFGLSIYSGTSRMFSYLVDFTRGEEKAQRDNREDLIDEILDRSMETGQIDSLERELIESILKFNDKIVREVMIPRGDVVALDINEESRRVLRKVIEEGYSRMPVYRESMDNIVGIIYAKDLLTMVDDGAAIVLQDLLRAPYYVPESKKISQLLREMQLNKVHLAIVVDEFGGTEGIVTLEDVLEEIVGEIQDEYDEALSELVRDDKGDVHFSGSMTVDRFNELLEADIPEEEDYDTMAGFVQKLAGKLPQKNEVYNHGEMYFYVEDVARHRIKRLRASFKEHPAQPENLGERRRIPETKEHAVKPGDHADAGYRGRSVLSESKVETAGPEGKSAGERKPRQKSGTHREKTSGRRPRQKASGRTRTAKLRKTEEKKR